MAVKIETGKALASINLTPLIDVVFLLLIFFLVATKFAEEEREIRLPLPEATQAQPLIARSPVIFVNIDKAGGYVVRDQQLDLRSLEQLLLQAAEANPGKVSVVIRAHRNCPWQAVVHVLDICARAKIDRCRATVLEPRQNPTG